MFSRFPKAMLIDLDDTILAYGFGSGDIWRRVCQQYIDDLPGWTAEQLMEGIDSYRRWFWSDPERHRLGRLNLINVRHEIMLRAFRQMGIDSADTARRIGDDYDRQRLESVHPFPGAIETLETLCSSPVRLGMITNGTSASQRAKIDRFDLERFFDYILVEEEFGVGKPDERVYFHALKKLGAMPSEAWIVGDNLEWEVSAPQRLGITAIWHDPKGRGLPQGSSVRPDRIVRSLPELLQLQM